MDSPGDFDRTFAGNVALALSKGRPLDAALIRESYEHAVTAFERKPLASDAMHIADMTAVLMAHKVELEAADIPGAISKVFALVFSK